MPKAIEAPWTEIKEQFCKGVSGDILSDKYGVKAGTIYQRATRGDWKGLSWKQKAKIQEVAKRAINQRILQSAPIVDQAVQDWIEKSRTVAGKLVQRVDEKTTEPATPDGLLKLASALEKADSVGRKALGIETASENQATLTVNFGLQVITGDGQLTPQLTSDSSDTVDV